MTLLHPVHPHILSSMGVKIVALSAGDEATTSELIAKHRLRFPVGHDADPDALARATGAFVNDDPKYVQSTGLVLSPEGRIVVHVYSSGAIGRLVPEDVIGRRLSRPRTGSGRWAW